MMLRVAPSRGYTLIEVMMVVALLAILIGGAAVAVRGPVNRARFESGIERFEFIDQTARSHCRQASRAAYIDLDPENDRIRIWHGQGERANGKTHSLGTGCRLARVRKPGGDWTEQPVRLSMTELGETVSYAVEFVSADEAKNAVLVIAGISGEAIRCDTEEEADALLRLLETRWFDAD